MDFRDPTVLDPHIRQTVFPDLGVSDQHGK
jgi:hypothetical protein